MKWISVEERLPDYGKAVWLWGSTEASGKDREYEGRMGFREKTNSAGEHFVWQDWPEGKGSIGDVLSVTGENLRYIAWDVTHWAPLPDPPEGDEGGDEWGETRQKEIPCESNPYNPSDPPEGSTT